jgi:hypothetical protein
MHKQKKLHYHWMPDQQEVVKNQYTLHATICVECTQRNTKVNWRVYAAQRKKTPKKYVAKSSYNASLPDHLSTKFNKMYYKQAKYFNVEV